MKGYVQAVGGGLLMTFVIGEASEHKKSVPLHASANAYGTVIVAQTSAPSSVALDLTLVLQQQQFRAIYSEPAERLADEVSKNLPRAPSELT